MTTVDVVDVVPGNVLRGLLCRKESGSVEGTTSWLDGVQHHRGSDRPACRLLAFRNLDTVHRTSSAFSWFPFLSGAGEHLPFPAPVIVQQEWTEVLNCFQNTGRRECCAVLIVTVRCAPDG